MGSIVGINGFGGWETRHVEKNLGALREDSQHIQ